MRSLLTSNSEFVQNNKSVFRFNPTGFGWVVIVLICLSWTLAVNYNNNLLYAVLSLWVSLLITTVLFSWYQFKSVEFSGWQTDHIYADNYNEIQLSINKSGFEGKFYLNNHISNALIWICKPSDPGRQTLTSPNLNAIDSFGLWRFSKNIPNLENQTVLANPIEHQKLETTINNQANVLEKEDIAALKSYHSDDSYREIDWKATARAGELISREWEGNQNSSIHHLSWWDLESLSVKQKKETLTAWVIELYNQQQGWSLEIPNYTFGSDNSAKHRDQCLYRIAEASV